MTDLDDAVDFFNAYLDIDYQGRVAAYSEPEEILEERWTAILSFFRSTPEFPMSPDFGKHRGWPPERLAKYAAGWTR